MNRFAALAFAVLFLTAELAAPLSLLHAESAAASRTGGASVDMFDAMQSGDIEATFVAKNSHRGRIVLENKTDKPLTVEIPDAFIGLPLAQMGGMGGGMMGGGGMGGGMGGQQSVGGGGGGGRGGGGRGGGGRGGGRGGFNIPPEKIVRVDVPLLCLDHGLKDPSSSKPYVIRPIENFVKDPALIQIVTSYANGELPAGAAQAAVWNVNSKVGWDELASKLTGTVRNINRESYFTSDEIKGAMGIVAQARQMTANKKVKPRPFKLPGEKDAAEVDAADIVSPGEEAVPAAEENTAPVHETDEKPAAEATKEEVAKAS